jgi:hypothetical protein
MLENHERRLSLDAAAAKHRMLVLLDHPPRMDQIAKLERRTLAAWLHGCGGRKHGECMVGFLGYGDAERCIA